MNFIRLICHSYLDSDGPSTAYFQCEHTTNTIYTTKQHSIVHKYTIWDTPLEKKTIKRFKKKLMILFSILLKCYPALSTFSGHNCVKVTAIKQAVHPKLHTV